MKILITADPELPVPPILYGGIERVVDMLVRGLVTQGHEVFLVAHRESKTAGTLIPYPGTDSRRWRDVWRNTMTVTRTALKVQPDIVHSFGRIAYLAPLLPFSLPKLMTYQREVTPRSVWLGHRLSRGTLHFCAISDWMMQETRHLATWHRVFNGVPMATYDFVPAVPAEAPLVFLGRIEHIKGTHLAIDIARRSGRRLIIAGNIPEAHRDYFAREVAPHLDDDRVHYIGPVDDVQKNQLLGSAAAFLMPILWEEPFGIVMAEALACATPVLGLRRGSVPEVVADGITGYVCDSAEALAARVAVLALIDRAACRARAEQLFSDDAIVEAYLDVYDQLINRR